MAGSNSTKHQLSLVSSNLSFFMIPILQCMEMMKDDDDKNDHHFLNIKNRKKLMSYSYKNKILSSSIDLDAYSNYAKAAYLFNEMEIQSVKNEDISNQTSNDIPEVKDDAAEREKIGIAHMNANLKIYYKLLVESVISKLQSIKEQITINERSKVVSLEASLLRVEKANKNKPIEYIEIKVLKDHKKVKSADEKKLIFDENNNVRRSNQSRDCENKKYYQYMDMQTELEKSKKKIDFINNQCTTFIEENIYAKGEGENYDASNLILFIHNGGYDKLRKE